MDKITVLPVSVNQDVDINALFLSNNKTPLQKNNNFSQMFAKEIRQEQTPQASKNSRGKAATSRGNNEIRQQENTAITQERQTRQSRNKAENNERLDKRLDKDKQYRSDKAESKKSVRAEQNNTTKKADNNTQTAQQAKSTNESKNDTALKEADSAAENLVDTKKIEEEQDALENSAQLLQLLQDADQTSTQLTQELTQELTKEPQLLQSAQDNNELNNIAEDVLDKNQQVLSANELLNKSITLTGDGNLSFNNADQNNNVQQAGQLNNALNQTGLSADDLQKIERLLKDNQQLIESLKASNEEIKGITDNSENGKIIISDGKNIRIDPRLLEKLTNNEKLAQIADDINSGKLEQQLEQNEPLTPEQLALLALLRNSKHTKPNGETPPIIVWKNENDLKQLSKQSSLINSIAEQTKSTLADKSVNDKTPTIEHVDNDANVLSVAKSSIKQGEQVTFVDNGKQLDASKVSLLMANKSSAETPVNTLANNANQNNTGYSISEQQGIQALHAASTKVVDNGIQQQKIETFNQIQTLNIHRKDFTNALQDKVMIMVQQKVQQVDIRLDPPELGNMQVKMHLHNDQASVQFVVQNQQAKDALEQNMPKLREMLAQQGVNVGDANVDQGQQHDDEQQLAEQSTHLTMQEQDDEELANETQILSTNLFKGSATGVDYFA